MRQFLGLFLLGLSSGALIAALGTSLVVIYKATGILNFAQASIAMWGAFVYDELRTSGDLVLPVVGVPDRISLGDTVSAWPAVALGVVSTVVVGVAIHLLFLRWMRASPPLGKVVATVGLLVVMQALVVIRFGPENRRVEPVLPSGNFTFFDINVSKDRVVGLGLVILVAIGLALYYRYTRSGLGSQAAAQNPKGALLIGLSPERLAITSWVIASAISGFFAIVLTSLTGLASAFFPLLVVPALAAALMGRFSSVVVAMVTGVVIGCVQSGFIYFQDDQWIPAWLRSGLPDLFPLAVIAVTLFVFGNTLPDRSALAGVVKLPRVPETTVTWRRLLVAAALLIGALYVLSPLYRLGLIVTLITMLLVLSLVLLTGWLGQISLAQAAFAGAAAFFLSRLADGSGVPFPIAVPISIAAATALGVLAGIPALRIRGPQLAVVTLAFALAAERLVLRNPSLVNEAQTAPVPSPTIGGIDLGPLGGEYPREVYGIVVVVVLCAVIAMVANIRRGISGKRLLAVRGGERAAAAGGINVVAVKLSAFALSAAIAATGGVLSAYLRGQVTPEGFGVFVGLSLLAVAYLGGITSISGAAVAGVITAGGIAFVAINQRIDLGDYYGLITGLGLTITAILNPEGIALKTQQQFRDLMGHLRRRGRHDVDGHTAASDAEVAA